VSRTVTRIVVVLSCLLLGTAWFGPRSAPAFDKPWDAGHNTTKLPPNPPYKPPKDPCEKSTGSPVYLRVGNLVLGFTDMELPGAPIPMEVHRNYNNQEKYNGPFGYGWVSTFTFQLIPVVRNNTIEQVIIRKDLGQRLVFTRNADGSFTPENKDSYDVLVDNGDGTFTLNPICSACGGAVGLQYTFNANGYLDAITDANGNRITFTYDAKNRLVKAEDNSGRFFTYTYTAADKVAAVTDSAGRTATYRYDENDNLIAATNPAGNTISYAYDADHNLIAMIDPRGNTALTVTYDDQDRVSTYSRYGDTVTYTYDPDNNQTTKTDSFGNAVTFTYDPVYGVVTRIHYNNGTPNDTTDDFEEVMEYDDHLNLVKFTDGRGFVTTYTYDDRGHKTSETDALGNVRTYTYDDQGHLLTATDPKGVVTKYEYDDRGNLIKKYQAYGTPDQIVESWTYDDLGHKLTHTDANGNTTTYGYDDRGRLITVTDPYGQVVTRNTYNDLGLVIQTEDVFGHATSYEYDALGRKTAVIDALGNRSTTEYDANGNVVRQTDVNGAVTTYEYNFFNQLVKVTDPNGNVTEYGYTVRGNLKWSKDPLGHYTYYEYNGRGLLVEKIVKIGDDAATADDDDLVTTYAYDASGNRISTTLPGGGVITETYDGLGRVIARTLPTGETITFAYDANGKITKQANGNGLIIQYEYDNLGRMKRIYDSLGTIRSYTYDGLGHPLTITDGNGRTTSFTYDKHGKQVRRTYPDGSFETINYDSAGRIQSIIDRGGSRLSFQRDKLGRPVASIDALGHKTTAVYKGDRLVTLIDPKGNPTHYIYDAAGNRTKEIYADGTVVEYTFDAANRMISRKAADGTVVTFTYDERGLLTKRDYPGDNDDIFTYGPNGELLSAVNKDFTVTRTYDQGNRLLSESINGRTVQYAYDTTNLVRTVTYPGGRVIKEKFDVRERLAAVTDANDATLFSFQYNGLNKRSALTYANGITAQYQYDDLNLLSAIVFTSGGSPVADYAYGRNAQGRLSRIQDNINPDESALFQYDLVDRLTGFKRGDLTDDDIPSPTRDLAYGYDPVNNILARTEDGTVENRTVNEVNAYLSAHGVTLTHDANGDLTDDGSFTYSYDAMHRLVAVHRKADGQEVARIAYDALGRMASLTVGGQTVFFAYDMRQRIIEESDGTTTIATYVYGTGQDEILLMERGGQTTYFHHGAVRNILVATDEAGAIVERYRYDPYGRVFILAPDGTNRTESAIGNTFFYKGKRYIPTIGLYYFRARFYSPALNRFITRDPSGYNDGLNLYEYARANPVNFMDPLGLAAKPTESCKVSTSIGFDMGKLAKVTKVIKAFGGKFKVGGGVQVTASACTAKCCKKQITYTKWELAANLSMTFSGPVPNLGIAVPGVGTFGVIGTVEFGIKGSGTFAQTFDKNCNITCASEVCVGVYGSVSLMAGAQLAEAGDDPQVSDPFGGEVGIKGSAGASGSVCYGCQGWKVKACVNGKIELIATVKVFWVSFGGSVELIGGETCTQYP